MKHRLLILLVALAALAAPSPVRAACGSIPFVFTDNTSLVSAGTTNANNNFFLSCLLQVDNTMIGPAGIYPSQLIPSTIANGTFGAGTGTAGYKFAVASGLLVPLTVAAPTGQSADIFDVTLNGVVKVWVDSAGILHAPNAPALSGFTVSRGLVTDASGNVVVAADLPVLLSGVQTIAGVKTFSSPPVMSGASITALSIPNGALANSTISSVALGGTLATLTFGSHLSVSTYNGSAPATIGTDATNTNTPSQIVTRDASGNFAAGTITAALTGNASTATALATARAINGVNFDGTAPITIKATATNALTIGAHLTGTSYDGSAPVTIGTDATSANTGSTIVLRDAAGGVNGASHGDGGTVQTTNAAGLGLGSRGTALNGFIAAWGLTGGGTQQGALKGGTASVVAGVTSSFLEAQTVGSTSLLAMNSTGDLGVVGSLKAVSSVVAGSATAGTATAGDVWASRSASTGQINLGGSTSSVSLDYGVTVASQLTTTATQFNIGTGGGSNTILGFGTTGINISSHTTAPGAATAPAGSIWIRTVGASVGGRIYINQDGATTWTAIAGV